MRLPKHFLTDSKKGRWKGTWLVIANEDESGNPIFVDLASDNIPVFTARHGEGKWQPELIADSFQGFVQVLEQVQSVAQGRENPVKLEKNPLTKAAVKSILKYIKQINPNSNLDFWKGWFAQ